MKFTPLTELQLARYNFYDDAKRKYINHGKFLSTIKNRFYAKIRIPEKENDCLLWIGAKKASNYGHMRVNRKNFSASRLSYSFFVGNVPDNLEVCHTCDNPQCVHPDHLFLGTHKENMIDRKNKDRDSMKKGERYKHAYDNRGERSGNAKLKDNQVEEIKLLISQKVPQYKIAKLFGIDPTTVSYIKTGKTWRHVK